MSSSLLYLVDFGSTLSGFDISGGLDCDLGRDVDALLHLVVLAPDNDGDDIDDDDDDDGMVPGDGDLLTSGFLLGHLLALLPETIHYYIIVIIVLFVIVIIIVIIIVISIVIAIIVIVIIIIVIIISTPPGRLGALINLNVSTLLPVNEIAINHHDDD